MNLTKLRFFATRKLLGVFFWRASAEIRESQAVCSETNLRSHITAAQRGSDDDDDNESHLFLQEVKGMK